MKTVWQIELMIRGVQRTDVSYSRAVYTTRDLAELHSGEFKAKCVRGISYEVVSTDIRYIELSLQEA